MPLEIDYHDLDVHRFMLRDELRCESFRRAIEAAVAPGMAVLDLGAGTGLLAMFAARAGARKVYAVERASIAVLAERIIRENRLDDRIHVIHGEMDEADLPEPVDMIVSEWLGGYGVDENLLPVVARARDRWLKPDGIMIPGTVESWFAPAFDDALEADVTFWLNRPYGLEYSAIAVHERERLHCCRSEIRMEHLCATPALMWRVDPASITVAEAAAGFATEAVFTIHRTMRCNALAAWFRADLGNGITLSNEPSPDYTHWGRWIFPLHESRRLRVGAALAARFSLRPESRRATVAEWLVEAAGWVSTARDVTSLNE
ncbi:class I SAM-dependent methyltransferase [bacterium]|nr:class I SAM-dependent methyltransferase [candidate division CSSED10-310 bacterium]